MLTGINKRTLKNKNLNLHYFQRTNSNDMNGKKIHEILCDELLLLKSHTESKLSTFNLTNIIGRSDKI